MICLTPVSNLEASIQVPFPLGKCLERMAGTHRLTVIKATMILKCGATCEKRVLEFHMTLKNISKKMLNTDLQA